MASVSAQKRLRQDAKKKLRNRARKSVIATYEKKFLSAITDEKVEDAQTFLQKSFSAYDKAVKKGVVKKNTADRKKSRLSKKLNKLTQK